MKTKIQEAGLLLDKTVGTYFIFKNKPDETDIIIVRLNLHDWTMIRRVNGGKGTGGFQSGFDPKYWTMIGEYKNKEDLLINNPEYI